MTQRAADWAGRATNRLLLLLACLAIFLPLVLTLYLSVFNEQMIVFPPHGYTLAWYGQIVGKFGGAIWTSLRIALTAVALSLLIGVPAGIGLSRYRFTGRDALGTFLLSPLTIPGIAIGLAIYVLAVWIEERTGIELAGSIRLLIMAHVLITMPWVVRLCLASLTNHERTTEEAAASLGANPLMVLLRVTLPAMRPGIVAAALFAFIVSFENLELNLFLVAPGLTTLPVAVLQYLQYHIDPLVAAVAVAQMVVVGAALLLLDRFVRLGQVL
ncbi:MAG: putative spermidine/putrescine transport system permease protein [Acetobacteraceae bacterium]|nr:putative spermidine/putrescine transport system permease protein [Acetobacteraceae bacterium]